MKAKLIVPIVLVMVIVTLTLLIYNLNKESSMSTPSRNPNMLLDKDKADIRETDSSNETTSRLDIQDASVSESVDSIINEISNVQNDPDLNVEFEDLGLLDIN